MKLLLAEDEADLAKALGVILKHNGYTVDIVGDGIDALDYARVGTYDGLILDVMMPGMDGMEVLRHLRAEGIHTPALFLTARNEVDDRIRGLDLGADDYLTKPFDMGELLARIRAMLRRKEDFTPNDLVFEDLCLSRRTYELRGPGDASVRLAGREFQMMEMLMESPGRVISVDLFMNQIWSDAEADPDVVWVYISNLRKKLKNLGTRAEIRSTRGLGYSIVSSAK